MLTGPIGFTVFEAPAGGTNQFTFDALNDEIDSGMDDNLKIILKKLSKKDPVTRHKGLLELQRFIVDADVETIKQILSLWPKHYNNCSNDHEPRVREAVQQAHGAIVAKAGKNIAPYLKLLSGSWVSSQFDSHAIASSVAKTSYEKSFSTAEKQKNMLLHCESELLEYFTNTLTVVDINTFTKSK